MSDAPREVAPAPTWGFEEAFRESYLSLVRALTAACGDAEVAADCVQDAWVKAHVRWRRISAYDNPIAWVRRVAIHKMRDHFRREARGSRARALLAAGSTFVEEPVVGAGGGAIALVASLPPQQRLAMSLYYVEGLTVAEVAAAMSISEGAVKFHMNQGRERLRPRLVEASDA
ncbi:MAG TPA: sigma-70 family RNA polymerase sigma factor [Acidimicrobiales bacterium]|nr:sigma-70 family RNA polymerase sigma factor [Acidimicrobiales bacterium]